MNKTAATYIDGSVSMETQRELCRQAAQRLGLNITDEYIEYHGARQRPARRRMMRDLLGHRHRRSDVLLVATPDRLTHRRQTWERLRGRLNAVGVRITIA